MRSGCSTIWIRRQHEIHVVQSNYAQAVLAEELPGGLRLPEGAQTHSLKSMNAPFASGSNPLDAMVVIPCTMGTLGRIAHGFSEDVLLRAADVTLKEKKKIILVPRETPLSLVHVRNFELLLLAGATFCRPTRPSTTAQPRSKRWWTRSWAGCWTIWASRTRWRPAGEEKEMVSFRPDAGAARPGRGRDGLFCS